MKGRNRLKETVKLREIRRKNSTCELQVSIQQIAKKEPKLPERTDWKGKERKLVCSTARTAARQTKAPFQMHGVHSAELTNATRHVFLSSLFPAPNPVRDGFP